MSFVCMFFGIIIRMYWLNDKNRQPPRFFAYYGDQEAAFSLTGELLTGTFPKKQAALVRAWAIIHEDELQAEWKISQSSDEIFRIAPLR